MTPEEWAALQAQGSQGMQPQVAPMSLADLAMEGVGAFLDEADVSKYLLPATLLGLVRYKKPGVSASARQTAENYHRRPVNDPLPVGSAPLTGNYAPYLHGTSAEFEQFKPGGHGAIYFSDMRDRRGATTQAEHIAGGPFGGRLVRAQIKGGKVFDPWNDPVARAIGEKFSEPGSKFIPLRSGSGTDQGSTAVRL